MTQIDFNNIDAYLFDLGGVVVDLNPQATIDAFLELGIDGLHQHINHSNHDGLFKLFEQGRIGEEDFIKEIQRQLPKPVSKSFIIDAWNKMLVKFPTERVRILEQLKRDKPVYLLSNTNGIHRDFFSKMAEGYDNIEDLFTQVYYSHLLGCSKPDTKPFEKVIEATGLQPSRTLFLDDSQANLDTASKLGFQIVLMSKENNMECVFAHL